MDRIKEVSCPPHNPAISYQSQHVSSATKLSPSGWFTQMANHYLQKLNSLRIEADEATAKVEELQAKVKTLEQENLQKEQEITSLQHKNGLLESEVDKLETSIKDHKAMAEEGSTHSTQNETLQRRLQLLEEEAEEADKNLRETNDKYVLFFFRLWTAILAFRAIPDMQVKLTDTQASPN